MIMVARYSFSHSIRILIGQLGEKDTNPALRTLRLRELCQRRQVDCLARLQAARSLVDNEVAYRQGNATTRARSRQVLLITALR